MIIREGWSSWKSEKPNSLWAPIVDGGLKSGEAKQSKFRARGVVDVKARSWASCSHGWPCRQCAWPDWICPKNSFNAFNSALSYSFVPEIFSFRITRFFTYFARCANFKVDKVSP